MNELARLSIDRKGDVLVAAIDGEVDVSNAADIGEELTRQVPNDALGVVLDLTGTTYLDSAGIRLLFELYRRLNERQQTLRSVVPPGAAVRRVLELTNVQSTIPVDESVDRAIELAGDGKAAPPEG